MESELMIYGATGYMGRLTTRLFLEPGIKPVLAGRDEKVKLLAEQQQLSYRVFSLDDSLALKKNLNGISLLVNLAGPFNKTHQPLVAACVEARVHYIDISGEVTGFETVLSFNEQAKQSGIMLMPGTGFGIVPTDVMALHLKQRMPDATHLILAFAIKGGVSQGTMRTGLKGIHKPGVIRVNGRFETCKPAQQSIEFIAEGKKIRVISNPWRGDLLTAFMTTGIQNIETYSAFPKFLVMVMKNPGLFGWLMQSKLLNAIIGLLPEGPDDEQLKKGKSWVYGKVTNDKGEEKESLMTGPEAYLFSAMTTVEISKRILNGEIKPGFQTPAGMYGVGLLNGMVQFADK